jgi:hypothetical protein
MQPSQHLLDLARRSSPLVRDTLRRYSDAPLAELLGGLKVRHVRAWQERDDLLGVISDQTAALHGTAVADEVAADLRSHPIVPTSNHFGVDTFADSVQGTLLFSLRPGGPRNVVVLGFGSISLNNLTYPMGLRLYDSAGLNRVPQRLPVFANRLRHCAVIAAGPFDGLMVERAQARLRRMRQAGEITAFGERAGGDVLSEEYAAAATLSLPSYGLQGIRVNTGLWRRMFSGGPPPVRLVQLPIEPICAALLSKDLQDPASLLHVLFFNPRVREALLASLDGAQACWRRERLHSGQHGGTIFFWGLSAAGRRVPLTLEGGVLAGIDEHGQRHQWPFVADGIIPALLEGKLLPSLFTCFAALAFARGLLCVGGYYQVGYLPVMQQGVIDALLHAGGDFQDGADRIAQVPTDLCLAGVQGVVRVLPDGSLIPAGPVEIAGSGGLTRSDLDQLQSVPVREAHLAAFPELLDHLVPAAALPPDWARRLAAENGSTCRHVVRLEGG